MRTEDKLLFTLCRQNFLSSHRQAVMDICRNHEIAWDVVYSTARQHGVVPLIYSNLQQCVSLGLVLSQGLQIKFQLYSYHDIFMEKQRTAWIKEIVSFFHKKSVDVMLVNDTAMDTVVYNQPWFANQNDIDVIVRPGNGDISENDRKEAARFLKGKKWVVECGYLRHHDMDLDGVLPLDFERIWNDARRISSPYGEVFIMSPEDMLIAACVNSCRKRFFRLKALCDIAEIIGKHSALNWDALTDKANAYGCSNIVYTALLVARETLGCEFPGRALEGLPVMPARAAVVRGVLNYLNRRTSLASLYPFSVEDPAHRAVNVSLILPYVTYSRYQFWQKVKGAVTNRRQWTTLHFRPSTLNVPH